MAEVSFLPEELNIRVYEGDTWTIEATHSQSLVNHTVIAKFLPESSSGSLITLNHQIINAALGQFTFGQNKAEDSGHYEVTITPVGGLPRTYIRGRVSVVSSMG